MSGNTTTAGLSWIVFVVRQAHHPEQSRRVSRVHPCTSTNSAQSQNDRNLKSKINQLVAEFFLTARRVAEDLLPDFLGFHAKVNSRRRRIAANPADHFAVHRDAQRLE